MNISAPFIAQFFTSQLKQVLPFTDIIIGNEAEAEAWATANKLTATKGSSDEDFTKYLQAIAKNLATFEKKNDRPRTVVITQGPKSTIVVTSTAPDSPKVYGVHPVADNQIVDTNGAGDAFAGGFLGALVAGKSLDECVETGHKMGAMSVQQVCFLSSLNVKFILIRLGRSDLNTNGQRSKYFK